MADQLFVYGTLLSGAGHPMQCVLRDGGTLVGTGRARGRLYDFGAFPALVGGSTAVDGWVPGEVYRLGRPGVTLGVLDAYEGCDRRPGSGFRRVRRPVMLDGERAITVWMYVFEGDLRGARALPPVRGWWP